MRDIAIQKRENDVALGTFGRSFYILDNYAPLRALTKEVLEKDGHIFPIKDALMFVEDYPLGTLGSREKGFQGESYFSVPNPPIVATFIYYLKESIQTLEDKRKERERELIRDNKAVPYPTYEQMRAEEEEETPYIFFTILDEDDNVVRRLRAPARKGLQRMTWDLRYPDLRPTRTQDASPTSSGPSSTFVLPGQYKVFLSKWVAGEITQLTDPMDFTVKTLGIASLPAEDRAELVEFQSQVRKLSHKVNTASAIMQELSTRVGHYKAALKSVTVSHKDLYAEIRALELKLAELGRQLFGDRTYRSVDQDAEPGLNQRLSAIMGEQRASTSAPTQTQRDNYRIVEEEFSPIYSALKQIVATEVKSIEKKLDDIGAPYTPGRLPDWK